MKAGKAAARTVGRTTANIVRKTGTAAVRASGAVGRAAVRGQKFVLRGFRRGMLKGKRTLREVRQSILGKFGFKRIWVERRGPWFELWGEFNAKVRLAVWKATPGKKGEVLEGPRKGRATNTGQEMRS